MKCRKYMLQTVVYTNIFIDTVNAELGDCRDHTIVTDLNFLKGKLTCFCQIQTSYFVQCNVMCT